MPEDDRQPDARRLELPGALQVEAQAERDDDLGDERDEERAAGVAGALQSAGIRQRERDEESRDTQVAQQLSADQHDRGIVETEGAEQLLGEEQEDDPDR